MPSQIDLTLKESPNGRPKYLIGKEKTLQPRILARPSAIVTWATWTNFGSTILILKLETTSKHKNKQNR
jgi:hypothetical protein